MDKEQGAPQQVYGSLAQMDVAHVCRADTREFVDSPTPIDGPSRVVNGITTSKQVG